MKFPKTSKSATRTSDLLKDIADETNHTEISIDFFLKKLGDRSFALAILIFSLPNSLPIPSIPGFSTITGIPILFIALQIVCGKKSIWLPKKVGDKTFHQQFLRRIIHKALPVILKLEKFTHPRFLVMCGPTGERVIGIFIAVMAFILALPIVGGNFLPGFSISLLAFGLLEKDGIFEIFSLAFVIITLYLMYELVFTVAGSAIQWITG